MDGRHEGENSEAVERWADSSTRQYLGGLGEGENASSGQANADRSPCPAVQDRLRGADGRKELTPKDTDADSACVRCRGVEGLQESREAMTNRSLFRHLLGGIHETHHGGGSLAKFGEERKGESGEPVLGLNHPAGGGREAVRPQANDSGSAPRSYAEMGASQVARRKRS